MYLLKFDLPWVVYLEFTCRIYFQHGSIWWWQVGFEYWQNMGCRCPQYNGSSYSKHLHKLAYLLAFTTSIPQGPTNSNDIILPWGSVTPKNWHHYIPLLLQLYKADLITMLFQNPSIVRKLVLFLLEEVKLLLNHIWSFALWSLGSRPLN